MEKYRVLIRKSVYKDFDRIPKEDVRRIIDAIGKQQDDPRPPQSKKLSGEDKYRLRCGSYRVIYEIRENALVVYVVKARHRKDVHK